MSTMFCRFFRTLKFIDFLKDLMTSQGTPQMISAQTSKAVNSTPKGIILPQFKKLLVMTVKILPHEYEGDSSNKIGYLENLTQEYEKSEKRGLLFLMKN